MDDLYLKIIRGELPTSKVYEDEHTFAFLDIHPASKGHTLVVPKVKFRNIFDIDSESLARVMETVQKVAHAQKEALGAEGVTLVVNNEHAGGQEIFHLHVHVIPRFENDNVFTPPTHVAYADGEKDAVAEKIARALT